MDVELHCSYVNCRESNIYFHTINVLHISTIFYSLNCSFVTRVGFDDRQVISDMKFYGNTINIAIS
jgi:hypothetical protein